MKAPKSEIIFFAFTFLPRLPRIHNKIDLITEKEIFRRSQDIVRQYSCFRFIVIISVNTE